MPALVCCMRTPAVRRSRSSSWPSSLSPLATHLLRLHLHKHAVAGSDYPPSDKPNSSEVQPFASRWTSTDGRACHDATEPEQDRPRASLHEADGTSHDLTFASAKPCHPCSQPL
jgi:hypothetical protein